MFRKLLKLLGRSKASSTDAIAPDLEITEVSRQEMADTIAQMRALFLEQFREDLRAMDPDVTTAEALAYDADDRLYRSERLGLPMRIDAMRQTRAGAPELLHLPSRRMLSYGLLQTQVGTPPMTLMLEEVTWDGVCLMLPYRLEGYEEALMTWYSRHFNERPATAATPSGSVHYMSDPVTEPAPTPTAEEVQAALDMGLSRDEIEVDEGFTYLDIDFGSAPVEAFWSLVDDLSDLGYDVIRFVRPPEVPQT